MYEEEIIIPNTPAELSEYIDEKIDAYNAMDKRKRKEKSLCRIQINELIQRLNKQVGFNCYKKIA